MLTGQHLGAKESSSLDEVRKLFVEKMKSTSQVHSLSTTAAVKIADSPINNHFSQIFQKQEDVT